MQKSNYKSRRDFFRKLPDAMSSALGLDLSDSGELSNNLFHRLKLLTGRQANVIIKNSKNDNITKLKMSWKKLI